MSRDSTTWIHWLLLSGILLLVFWTRYLLIGVPLERDEGEYAYGGQLLLQMIPPYQLLYNMKLPGIYAIYAAILSFFGQTHEAIHMGLLFVNLITILALFFLSRLLLSATAAVSTAATFATLSIGYPVQGLFANAEHFVILPVIGGAILLYLALDRINLAYFFLAGLCFGLGLIVKQHGALFIIWALLVIAVDRMLTDNEHKGAHIYSPIGLILLGAALPYVLTSLLLFQAGVFEKYLFWTFDYARAYTTQVSLTQAWDALSLRATRIIAASPLLWVLALFGVPLIARTNNRRNVVFVSSFTIFSVLAVCPGGFFRPHYFVLLLPAAALAVGVTIDYIGNFPFADKQHLLRKGLAVTSIIVALVSSLALQYQFLWQLTPAQVAVKTYGANPFNESLAIARFIKQDSQQGDRIAIIGSEPQIYFYTGLHSASGYIYMYPLMEKHDLALSMQREMIKDIEAIKPKYLIYVHIRSSWLQTSGSHRLIFDWFEQYVTSYEQLGLVKIYKNDTLFSWIHDLAGSADTSYWVEILKKKDIPG